MGVLGSVGYLHPRSVVSASQKAIRSANKRAGSYLMYTHMIAQRRKVMRGKAVDRRS